MITPRKRLGPTFSTLLVAATLGAGLVACAPDAAPADAETSATPASESESLSLLFMLDAEAGTLTHVDGVDYTLELTTAGERMIWFSDRPDRKAGSMGTDEFITVWPEFGFDEDPPNIGFTANGIADGVSIVATMTDPAYNTATAVFTANLEVLFASPNRALEDGEATVITAEELPTALTDVAMFIDDAHEECKKDSTGAMKCTVVYNWNTAITFQAPYGTVAP